MGSNFFQGTDARLYTGSAAFATKITATPTAFGLTAAQATAYGVVNTAYATAYTAAIDPLTRTKGKTAAKNAARDNLRTAAANLARIINGTPTVTDEQKIDLGLNVRAQPVPIPPPSDAPNLDIVSRTGTTVSVKMHDGTGSRRGRPAGVQGASLFSFVGPTPPADVTRWMFEGNTTRTTIDVRFDASLPPGTLIWLTGFWYNPRGQSGPGCTPVSAILAGGGMNMAA